MTGKRGTTDHPGVRYREHPTRKHGVKRDRYYSIYYRVPDPTPEHPRHTRIVEEGLGWASEGMTVQKAALRLGELKEARRTGQGAMTLREKREISSAQRAAEEAARQEQRRDSLTFREIFEQFYYSNAVATKSKASAAREEQFFRLWVAPVIGDLTLKQIAESDFHFQKIRKNMAEGKRPSEMMKSNRRTEKNKDMTRPAAARSVNYCMAMIRQVFNFARVSGLYEGSNPVRGIKDRKIDNKRFRFLTHGEAERLLEILRSRSLDVHDMCLLSLDCGLRAGEVFRLTWGDVDLVKRMIVLRDTKSGQTRFGYMTSRVKDMLSRREPKSRKELVFPGKNGKPAIRITNTFRSVVQELGFNEGITDPRQKVVFHTLRHSYASHLVQEGVNLYTVQKLLGHSTISQTERYSHLAPSTLQDAVRVLEKAQEQTRTAAALRPGIEEHGVKERNRQKKPRG